MENHMEEKIENEMETGGNMEGLMAQVCTQGP